MTVKETKEMTVFVCRTITAGDKALEGGISVTDAALLVAPLMSAVPALEGASQIGAELKDMDPAEAEELKQVVVAELDLRSDAAEAVAEQVVGVALQLAAAIMAVKAAKVAVV